MEQQYAQARVWDGEKQQRVNTRNLIVAQFHHTTSREKDPQLHTHCVIINATQLPDGRWRALSNEALYRNKLLLGAIYRNELAQECRKLGYEIEKRPQELFEINGYTTQQLEYFSKRRQHIEALVGPDATAQEKQWAALYQRPAKGKELPLEELVGWWKAQDEAIGLEINHPVPQPQQLAPAVEPVTEVSPEAAEAVKVAIEHCSERAVAFKRQAIEKFVLCEIKHF
ncbi:MAG TPA: MobF family relaxase, partial [Candidatus Caenarcaniphilales bacterium]